jgi:hypothetical protein
MPRQTAASQSIPHSAAPTPPRPGPPRHARAEGVGGRRAARHQRQHVARRHARLAARIVEPQPFKHLWGAGGAGFAEVERLGEGARVWEAPGCRRAGVACRLGCQNSMEAGRSPRG